MSRGSFVQARSSLAKYSRNSQRFVSCRRSALGSKMLRLEPSAGVLGTKNRRR